MRVQVLPFCLLVMIYTTCFTLALKIPMTMQKHLKPCQTELNLTDSTLTNIEKNDEKRELRSCLGACMLKREGVLNANGTFNKMKAINIIDPRVSKEDAYKAVDNCQNEVSKNICETAELLYKCFTVYNVL
uniref:Odorant binding protein 5 n=1 Tax=Cephus cinctus TaxID=211228 RepID=A0A1W6L173_CEPCN|nr:odorant binding protein 5 [Cephus cinctus]